MLSNNTPEILPLENGTLIYQPNAYTEAEADTLFTTLQTTLPWQQDQIRIADKWIPIPRLQAWFGERGGTYTYSGLTLTPNPWTPPLQAIKHRTESIANHKFNSMLANYYRNEQDSVGWHADNEAELGKNPVVASVSFGAPRQFQLRHKYNKRLKYNITLQHGDILVMTGELQAFWHHQIPKSKAPIGPRISLTYRLLLNNPLNTGENPPTTAKING